MSQNLEFGYGNSVGNDSVFAGLRTWVRTKKGFGIDATYHLGRPKDPDSFFAVLWQIKKSKRTQPTKQDWRRTVRLLVESPRSEENQFLNSIKRKLIRALINAGLPRLVRDKGYRYDDSRVDVGHSHP